MGWLGGDAIPTVALLPGETHHSPVHSMRLLYPAQGFCRIAARSIDSVHPDDRDERLTSRCPGDYRPADKIRFVSESINRKESES
jgi:hypothetical protein